MIFFIQFNGVAFADQSPNKALEKVASQYNKMTDQEKRQHLEQFIKTRSPEDQSVYQNNVEQIKVTSWPKLKVEEGAFSFSFAQKNYILTIVDTKTGDFKLNGQAFNLKSPVSSLQHLLNKKVSSTFHAGDLFLSSAHAQAITIMTMTVLAALIIVDMMALIDVLHQAYSSSSFAKNANAELFHKIGTQCRKLQSSLTNDESPSSGSLGRIAINLSVKSLKLQMESYNVLAQKECEVNKNCAYYFDTKKCLSNVIDHLQNKFQKAGYEIHNGQRDDIKDVYTPELIKVEVKASEQ